LKKINLKENMNTIITMNKNSGYIQLILGPMYAGKTNELIKIANRYQIIGKNIIAINHKKNIKYGSNKIASHDKKVLENNINVEYLRDIMDNYYDKLLKADIILIEELHFFEDAFEYITKWADNYHKHIIAVGLDGDNERNIYPQIEKLIPHAENVIKLTSLCKLSNKPIDAPFTKKIEDNKYICVSREKYLGKEAGYFELIFGPMYSGKTTELMRKGNIYKNIGKNVLAINHSINVRYDTNKISSHDRNTWSECLILDELKKLKEENRELYDKADVILIEELQFFKDAYNCVKDFVDNDNKIVIACGLDGNYKREPFGAVCSLVSFADKIQKINALCHISNDGTPASFTKRIVDNNELNLVGSTGKYIAVSREYYNKDVNIGISYIWK
jgi:thymidine kinase